MDINLTAMSAITATVQYDHTLRNEKQGKRKNKEKGFLILKIQSCTCSQLRVWSLIPADGKWPLTDWLIGQVEKA
jgi:hypothetical protein